MEDSTQDVDVDRYEFILRNQIGSKTPSLDENMKLHLAKVIQVRRNFNFSIYSQCV